MRGLQAYSPKGDPIQGNLFILGEECDIDIDDVDSDTLANSQLQVDITAQANSLAMGNL